MTDDDRNDLRARVRELFSVQGWSKIRVEPLSKSMRVPEYLLREACQNGKRFHLIRHDEWIVDSGAKPPRFDIRAQKNDQVLDCPPVRFGPPRAA
jgi:hypothetical protein